MERGDFLLLFPLRWKWVSEGEKYIYLIYNLLHGSLSRQTSLNHGSTPHTTRTSLYYVLVGAREIEVLTEGEIHALVFQLQLYIHTAVQGDDTDTYSHYMYTDSKNKVWIISTERSSRSTCIRADTLAPLLLYYVPNPVSIYALLVILCGEKSTLLRVA